MRTRFYFIPNHTVTSIREEIGPDSMLLCHCPPEEAIFVERFLQYLETLPEVDREWIISGTDEKHPARMAVQAVCDRWRMRLRFLDACQFNQGEKLVTELFVHY